jgi:OOP family OmpA-OmpF porin
LLFFLKLDNWLIIFMFVEKRTLIMKILKTNFLLLAMAALVISLGSCKTKKVVAESTPVAVVEEKPAPAPAPEPEKKEEPAPAPKPTFTYSNLQFEFNSAVLKTESYPLLDQVATELKQNTDVKLSLDGHSSAEGTAEHNQTLSEDRANSVKSYLVNAGVDGASLITKGYGETKPVSQNNDEAGRALNRRVEIKKAD